MASISAATLYTILLQVICVVDISLSSPTLVLFMPHSESPTRPLASESVSPLRSDQQLSCPPGFLYSIDTNNCEIQMLCVMSRSKEHHWSLGTV